MRVVLLVALLVAPISMLTAQQATRPDLPTARSYERKIPPKLAAEAEISEDSATVLALALVPRGEITVLELERERGTLIYSFDIYVPGRSGHAEVDIHAVTAAVVRSEHVPR